MSTALQLPETSLQEARTRGPTSHDYALTYHLDPVQPRQRLTESPEIHNGSQTYLYKEDEKSSQEPSIAPANISDTHSRAAGHDAAQILASAMSIPMAVPNDVIPEIK